MIEIIEQECHVVAAGLFTQPILKYTSILSHAYTLLAHLLQQKPCNFIDATIYYQQLGHALGEFVYTVTHTDLMHFREENT